MWCVCHEDSPIYRKWTGHFVAVLASGMQGFDQKWQTGGRIIPLGLHSSSGTATRGNAQSGGVVKCGRRLTTLVKPHGCSLSLPPSNTSEVRRSYQPSFASGSTRLLKVISRLFCPNSGVLFALFESYAEPSGDHRPLWKAFNEILRRCPNTHLPTHSPMEALANTFSSFFIDEISTIRSSFPCGSCSRVLNPPDTREVLQSLTCVTNDEARRLVPLAPCKSSDVDPL